MAREDTLYLWNLLESRGEDNVVTVRVKKPINTDISLIGSSSKHLKGDFYNKKMTSLSFQLEEISNKGVIAVKISYFSSAGGSDFFVFLPFERNDNKTKVSFTEGFVPVAGRLISIDRDGRISVLVGKILYVSKFFGEDIKFEQKLVSPDILCKYGVGDVDEKDLEKSSQKIKEKLDAEKIWKETIKRLGKDLKESRRQIEQSDELCRKWRFSAIRLRDALKIPFWGKSVPGCGRGNKGGKRILRGHEIKRVLLDFPEEN